MSRGIGSYGRQSIDDSDVEAVVDALRGDMLTTGPHVSRFEDALSEVCGGAPVVAVSNGTAALHLAYWAAGVGPGTSVVTSPLTFMATASMVRLLGGEVVFADVDEDTLCLDPTLAEAAIRTDTVAIAPVDFAGHPADLAAFAAIGTDRDVRIVEDAAHSLGGRTDVGPVGRLADFTTFSFHPVKTVTTGEGGAVAARNEEDAAAIRRLRSHGMVRDPADFIFADEGPWHQEVHEFAPNYRLSDIQAALGFSQLRRLASFVSHRSALVTRYREAFADLEGVSLQRQTASEPAWHLFVVRVHSSRRRRIFEKLRGEGIGVQVHYFPAHLHPVFASAGFERGDFPKAERAYSEMISLPLHAELTFAEQDRVIAALVRAVK